MWKSVFAAAKTKKGNNYNFQTSVKCLHNSNFRNCRNRRPNRREAQRKRVRGGEERRSDETQFSPKGAARRRKRSGVPAVVTKGQARKSARGMPWHQEPTKDATSCDKLRGAAHTHRSVDFRMGKPGRAILCQHWMNQIVQCGEPPELKHLSRARKRHQPRFRK